MRNPPAARYARSGQPIPRPRGLCWSTRSAIGCGYCVQACPYGTRYIHPVKHVADKCTLCYHRIMRGLQPACVQSCPRGVRIFGDLNDPESQISMALKQRRFRLLKPEMGTHPRCYYLDLDNEVI
ncbi:MAG: 4Fe-4S dicluster domain-containing protein [bacterium]